MSKRGRPPVLDDKKLQDIVNVITMGCSRRTAAWYVGCSPTTIHNTAERNEVFANKLSHADSLAVVNYVKNIRSAAEQAQYWRAAAWALERLRPDEYVLHNPDVVTDQQVAVLLSGLAQIVVDEVPVEAFRKRIMKRLDELTKQIDLAVAENHGGKVEVSVNDKTANDGG